MREGDGVETKGGYIYRSKTLQVWRSDDHSPVVVAPPPQVIHNPKELSASKRTLHGSDGKGHLHNPRGMKHKRLTIGGVRVK